MPLKVNDLSSRSVHGHCSNDLLNETCEKFFQIWSHKAVNISNDLIEYTIRRMQNDRLQYLFVKRNEFTNKENVEPFCQMFLSMEDDLERIKEYIRRFCLSTRNVYRHLRSDSRLYPKMSIDLDQGLMIKICRFIFKTKILIKIFSKKQHLTDYQHEQLNKSKTKKIEIIDPYKNITKAFIVLQSNFEILYGDILEKDFLQNVKTAVQTLPIILDTSKTIRLIFCALYKLNEPARQAEAEAIRQRRLAFCVRECGPQKQGLITTKISNKNKKFEIRKDRFNINQYNSATTPVQTISSPMKTFSDDKSIYQTKENSTRIQSTNNILSPYSTSSKTSKNRLSPSTQRKTDHSSKKSSTSIQKEKKPKSSSSKNKIQNKPKNKNKNASTTESALSCEYTEKSNSMNNNTIKKFKNTNAYIPEGSSEEKSGWTTWLRNATLSLANILPSNQTTNLNTNQSKPLLTTWASLDRISKL